MPRKMPLPAPARVALVGRELQDLERVAVGIAEVERLDPARLGIPVRQPLRPGGDLLDLVATEPEVGLLQVAGDDRDVLEPDVVAPGVGRAARPRGVAYSVSSMLAAENARRLVDRLTLEYNMARRNAITSALLEVAAGYEATAGDGAPDAGPNSRTRA